MPLPAKGNPISFLDLQNEFGGTDPISLSEYYGTGYTVYPSAGVPYYASGWPDGLDKPSVTVPHSGEPIALNRFHSAGRIYRFKYIVVAGGGGGGSGWPDNIGGGGGGGGGGGISADYFDSYLNGLSVVCTVGGGGNGGSYPTQQADTGGPSQLFYSSKSFTSGWTITAYGGQGGWGRETNYGYNLKGGQGGLGSYSGNAGGTWGGNPGGSNGLGAGGGGGGTDDSNNTTGVGGNGRYFEDLQLWVGGGGGGGGDYSLGAEGGLGGGGHGGSGNSSTTAGTDGTGGGGGGGSSTGGRFWGPGARGGHGAIWVYYPVTYGKVLSGGSESIANNFYIHRISYGSSVTLTAA